MKFSLVISDIAARITFGVNLPPVNWIQAHQNELQAISGLAIAVLTIVLIIVTAIYARANWLTMRLMAADVKFRTKPIPRLGLIAVKSWSAAGLQPWLVTLRTEHAPLCLIALSVQFVTGAVQREHFEGQSENSLESHPFLVRCTANQAPNGNEVASRCLDARSVFWTRNRLPSCALRASAGRRSPERWGLASEPCIGLPQTVPKLGKGFFEPALRSDLLSSD